MQRIVLKKDTGDLLKDEQWLGRLNHAECSVITCLYEHKDNIVSHEELLTAGWPNKIVAPNSLNVAIKNIRINLDKAQLKGVIETHVKKGFSWNSKYSLDIVDAIENKFFHTAETATPLEDTPTPIFKSGMAINNIHARVTRKKHLFSAKNMLHLWAIAALSILFVVLGVFYTTYWTPLTCHEISAATFCGVGDFRADMLSTDDFEGDYLFGYSSPNGEFFYVKI